MGLQLARSLNQGEVIMLKFKILATALMVSFIYSKSVIRSKK